MKVAVIGLIVANVAVSLKGFSDRGFFERFMFHTGAILGRKEWPRLLVSGFLHVNVMHLLFNMYALYIFGDEIEVQQGPGLFLLIYGLSLLGGDALALFFHRNHHNYTAVGASGAVSGVVFASIFLLPDARIMVFPLPFWLPTWVYAVFFTALSLFGIRSQRDNIGHEAHLGGAVTGMLVTGFLFPHVVFESPWLYGGILAAVLVFCVGFGLDPLRLGWRRRGGRSVGGREPPVESPRVSHRDLQKRELDRLLEKISAGGLESLSPTERKNLERISKELRESGRY